MQAKAAAAVVNAPTQARTATARQRGNESLMNKRALACVGLFCARAPAFAAEAVSARPQRARVHV